MFRVALFAGVAVALAAPAVQAQRGRRSPISKQDKPHLVTSDSVERLNPISPLIARRRELGIPDSVIGKLGTILSRLDATNARALGQVDSLAAHPGGPPALSDEALREGARGLPGGTVTLDLLFAEIGHNNDDAAAEVLKLLSGKVADRARDVMNDQKKKLAQLLLDSRGYAR
ncbi:MAG TPA: hypothetical protein VFK16_00555 [Gemmatimonadaceae bacterium]|nr:hypothetical protein [Gemmatimonadaceae bacterium]